jgi:CRISPR-associated endonuclease/helicase Cas3
MNRAERLREEERLYVQRCFSDREMADRLGVTRATVWKDRQELERQIPFRQDEEGRYGIDRSQYISEVRLNLYEALTLYLAARRASRQSQMAAAHATAALEKLATALHQPMTQRLVQAAESVPGRRTTANGRQMDGRRIMETLAQGWADRIAVRIIYHPFSGESAKTHLVRPYLIEPSQWSDSVYLIGYSDLARDVIPFKTERIERATLTTERFEWPEDFDEQRLLRHTWGIWTADRDPVDVRLKFAPGRATRRVKESIWHPLETVTDTPDGGCEWVCPVDEWREMVPWVRAWGADCEVMEPEVLRETLMGEARAVAERYGWSVQRDRVEQKQSAAADFFDL